jgi:4-diphosphocytidyl-2-C-methyl-D-erythritol kinase
VQRVVLKAYAKINLGLSVLGRRQDGYHELRTIYQSISLADRIEVRLAPGSGVRLTNLGPFRVPAGRENLAVRAAEAALRELRLRRQVVITLEKLIPPGSGLGGGSSDAAAVLHAVAHLSRKALPQHRLVRLASDLGSDVPFFLVGGRALGVGRGEEVYPLPDLPRRNTVVLCPNEPVNTTEAYRLLGRPLLTASRARPTIELFCSGVSESDLQMKNDFERLVFRRYPRLAGAKQFLLDSGAEAAALSGSGSAVFGLFEDRRKALRAAGGLWQFAPNLPAVVGTYTTLSRRRFQVQFRSGDRVR